MNEMLKKIRLGAALAAALWCAAVVAKEVSYWDPVEQCEKTAKCQPIPTTRDGRLDGGWYVAEGNTRRTELKVTGHGVNLILADGATLTLESENSQSAGLVVGTVWGNEYGITIWGQRNGTGRLVAKGTYGSAGIGNSLSKYESNWGFGEVKINGGMVTAIGGPGGAGIGGCENGKPKFTVTINGGCVTAIGGGCGYGAAVGGAGIGSGYISSDSGKKPEVKLTVNGGTLVAKGGDNAPVIGGGEAPDIGMSGLSGPKPVGMTVTGGSVKATPLKNHALNDGEETLHCVTVKCAEIAGDGDSTRLDLRFLGGFEDYGTNDIYSVDQCAYLWLPNGKYRFSLSNGAKDLYYEVLVRGEDVTVEPRPLTGLLVNGIDAVSGIGDGWVYESSILQLNEDENFVISGSAGSNEVQICVNKDLTVVLSNVFVATEWRPAFVVKDNVKVKLQMAGGVSYLAASNGASAVTLGANSEVNVAYAPGANMSEATIGVFNYGSSPSIAGKAKFTVDSGSFAVWSDVTAVEVDDFDFNGVTELIKEGSDPFSAKYANSYDGKSPYVVIAPFKTVSVRRNVPFVKDLVVSNGVEQLKCGMIDYMDVYRVMLGDDVYVSFASASEDRLVVGENPVILREIAEDMTVDERHIRLSGIRLYEDGNHYLESHGAEWIDTGVMPDKGMFIECCATVPTQSGAHARAAVFGARQDLKSDSRNLAFYPWYGNAPKAALNLAGAENYSSGFFYDEPIWLTCSVNDYQSRVFWQALADRATRSGSIENSGSAFPSASDRPLYLFASNEKEGSDAHEPPDDTLIEMRLYSLDILRNNPTEVVRQFVPFATEDGSLCGLYDKSAASGEKKYYFNQGAGAFKIGCDTDVVYRDWDATTGAPIDALCTNAIYVTAETATFEDGKWYAVTGTVSCGVIKVNGSANLILCDGAQMNASSVRAAIVVTSPNALTIWGQRNGTGKLTASGGWNSAAIGCGPDGSDKSSGNITINGGTVESKCGDQNGAGIGGSNPHGGLGWGGYGNSAPISINGGRVTAESVGSGAGIGGAIEGVAEKITISGGTIVSKSKGYGFGGPKGTKGILITGGSVFGTFAIPPVNAKGETLHAVTLTCPAEMSLDQPPRITLNSAAAYSLRDVVPVDGKYRFMLPDGFHWFTCQASDGGKTYYADVLVNGADVEMKFADRRRLQALIDATPTGGELYLDPGRYDTATVDRTMTIRGFDPEYVIIDGENKSRGLTVTAPDVLLEGIAFENGKSQNFQGGGGIYTIASGLVVSKCAFTNCHTSVVGGAICAPSDIVGYRVTDSRFVGCEATPEAHGGALFNPREVLRCEFTDNAASGAGGAIFRARNAKIEDCTFVRNKSVAENVYDLDRISGGGAIANVLGDYSVIVGCTFKDNLAGSDKGNPFAHGGAVLDCTRVERCAFIGNRATLGGAVSRVKSVVFSVFDGNRAFSATSDVVANWAAVESAPDGTTDCRNLTFVDCICETDGEATRLATDSRCATYDCLFVRCENGAADSQDSYAIDETPFVGSRYNVTPAFAAAHPGGEERGRAFAMDGASGLDGRPIAYADDSGALVYPAGCCGAVDLTLQQLIDETPTNGTCRVSAGIWTPAVIDKAITLLGANPESAVIEGKGEGRCLTVVADDSDKVEISGIGFANGYAGTEEGGGLHLRSSAGVAVSNCVFRSCQAALGGGASGKGLSVEWSRFENCTSTTGGGAAYNCTLRWCVFAGNSTEGYGGATLDCPVEYSLFTGNSSAKQGGAFARVATVEPLPYCNNSTFSDNRAKGSNLDATSGSYGIAVKDCLFHACRADDASGTIAAIDPFVDRATGDYRIRSQVAADYVGDPVRGKAHEAAGTLGLDGKPLVQGWYVVGAYGVQNLLQEYIDATPAGEKCEVPAGRYFPATVPKAKQGIGLVATGTVIVEGFGQKRCLLVEAPEVTVRGFTFRNGVAAVEDREGYGGGVLGEGTLSLVNCTFNACSADACGGGAAMAMCVTGCSFTDCTADGAEGAGGGGVCAVKTTESCSFVKCSATNGCGGAWRNYYYDNGEKYLADVIVRNCTFTDCSAKRYGGGTSGFGMALGDDGSEIVDCTFTRCVADEFGGGGVDNAALVDGCSFLECRAVDGGGIFNAKRATGCTFTDCTADGSGEAGGGGVSTVKATEGCSFLRCRAANGCGGGWRNYFYDNGGKYLEDVIVRNCTFTDCSAKRYGGGTSGFARAEGKDDRSQIVDCTFTRCVADEFGGGGVDNATLVDGCSFLECRAVDGGGIFNAKISMRCRVESCTATGTGGGVCSCEEIRTSLFAMNNAATKGGGTHDGKIYSCTFANNSCTNQDNKATAGVSSPQEVRDCLFCGCAPDDKLLKGNTNVASTVFYDPKNGDYHLNPQKPLLYSGLVGSSAGLSAAKAGKWTDPDGIPLVNSDGKLEYFYMGCYAFSPVVIDPTTVNVGDNRDHENSNLLTSLADVMKRIALAPSALADKDGKCEVKFADHLVKDGVVTIDIVQACVEVAGGKNCKVVIRPPEGSRLAMKGDGKHRAIHVAEGSSLELSGCDISGCLADRAGASASAQTYDGGAILNNGDLIVSNCTFTANSAGGASKIFAVPSGFGGAIANTGRAIVERSTFDGNEAANGGAICNMNGGDLSVWFSTFTGNRALAGNSPLGTNGGQGGAVSHLWQSDGVGRPTDTLLVNCTITGNAASYGGAVYAQATGVTSLELVNVLALGNAGECELYMQDGGMATLYSTWYGTRNHPTPADDAIWRDMSSAGGKGPSQVFAKLADGKAVGTRTANGGIEFPLATDATQPGLWVSRDAGYSNVYVSVSRAGERVPVRTWGGLKPRQAGALPILDLDQSGDKFETPPFGATAKTAKREDGPDLPPASDPCVIDSTDPGTVRAKFAAINENANALAENGVVTVTFDESVSAIGGADLATFTGFTNVTLVIRGPVRLTGFGLGRLFFVCEGNSVVFEDVAFELGNGNADDECAGGAVLGESCDVAFTRCEFMNCSASYGGAVCLDGNDCRAEFTECVFESNRADVARDFYNDYGCVFAFRRCDVGLGGIDGRPRVRVVHSPEEIASDPSYAFDDYYSDLATAIGALRRGSVLCLLDKNVEDELKRADLPADVEVKREYARIEDGRVVVEGGAEALADAIAMAKDEQVNEIELKPGRYAPATVPPGMDGLAIWSESAEACVIDGTLVADAVSGLACESAGVTVSNLTFSKCAAANGGGVSGAAKVTHCVFTHCSATVDGGGVSGDGNTEVLLSLFEDCHADGSGDAVSGVTAWNCTFVVNALGGSGRAADAASALKCCLLANCTAANGDEWTHVADDPPNDFVAWGENYTPAFGLLGRIPADGCLAKAETEAWTDLRGREMVATVAGERRLFAGAFAPDEAPDPTLQTLIDAAKADDTIELEAGVYGPATVPASKSGLVICAKPGANVVIDGCGLASALRFEAAGTVSGVVITNGLAARGGGVKGPSDAATAVTVRGCLILGCRATEAGGGCCDCRVESCTFAGNSAPAGSAVAHGSVADSVGCGESQTVSADEVANWFTAAEGDFVDAANGDWRIAEANWLRFATDSSENAKFGYEGRWLGADGQPLVRRVAGAYRMLAGAYGPDLNDGIQRLIDWAEGDSVTVPDGAYAAFVVPSGRDGLAVIHEGAPDTCTVDGLGETRAALVEASGVTLAGLTFANGAAPGEDGGGVSVSGLSVTVSNCVFTGCSAANGGAYAGSGRIVLCRFAGNVAENCGGAVYACDEAKATVVSGCVFTGNRVTDENSLGGAACAQNATFAGCFFKDNSAVCAGAIFTTNDVKAICCTFAGNESLGDSFRDKASACYSMAKSAKLDDCIFYRDTQLNFDERANVLFLETSVFVNEGADDWRVASAFWSDVADGSSGIADRIAIVESVGATTPDGAPLKVVMAGRDMLMAGAYGVAIRNDLQELIDLAEDENGTVSVPSGTYLPAVVPESKHGLTLVAEGDVTIDGARIMRCLTVEGSGVTLKGLTFANGCSETYGGGVGCEDGTVRIEAVIDCTFMNCSAENGGALAFARKVRGSRFFGNTAANTGGAIYQRQRDVTGSLFVSNRVGAVKGGAVIGPVPADDGTFANCTMYRNVDSTEATDIPAAIHSIADDKADDLADPASGDFHLRPDRALAYAINDYCHVTNAYAQGWVGADGEALARPAGDWAVMTCGCYCDWDMSIQSRVDAALMGGIIEVPEGVYPPLFIGTNKVALTIRPETGARVVIDAGTKFRAVTDSSYGLTLEGLVITNGNSLVQYGKDLRDGGGYLGVYGNGAAIRRCEFVDCEAEYGGGACAADLVESSVFRNCVAKHGGGVAVVGEVRTSLFVGNSATVEADGGFSHGVYGIGDGTLTKIRSCTFVCDAGDESKAYGVWEGMPERNVFCGCVPKSDEAKGNVVGFQLSDFADPENGDYRVKREAVAKVAFEDDEYLVEAKSWVSPDGRPLVMEVAHMPIPLAGAYWTDLDTSLQEWIDAALPGETVRVPAGVYAPVSVTNEAIAIVGEGGSGECRICACGLYRGMTVSAKDVTVTGFGFDLCDVTRWNGNGGAILGDGATTVASNCEFNASSAICGGGTAGMLLVSASRYVSCSALTGTCTSADAELRACEIRLPEDSDRSFASGSCLSSCTILGGARLVQPLEEGAKCDCSFVVAMSDAAAPLVVNSGAENHWLANTDVFVAGTLRPTDALAEVANVTNAEYVAKAAGWVGPDGRALVRDVGGVAKMCAGAYAPGDPALDSVRFLVSNAAGEKTEFADVEGVAIVFRTGCVVTIVGASGIGSGAEDEMTPPVRALRDRLATMAREQVADKPWYGVSADGMKVAIELNEEAAPVIASGDDVDLTGDPRQVSVRISNVKPDLWYGLAVSKTCDGEYVVPDGGWVQAGPDGKLESALIAPRDGDGAFYRPVATDCPPESAGGKGE